MLQQFSWQQFLAALAGLALIWYVVVILLFYRRQLFGLVSRLTGGPPKRSLLSGSAASSAAPLPHRWEKELRGEGLDELHSGPEEVDSEVTRGPDSLMGASRMPEGMSRVGLEQVSFVLDERAQDQVRQDQLGLVSDVLQDVKEVFQLLARDEGNKHDFFKLMAVVSEHYPGLSAHPSLRRINGFIAEHAPFALSFEELDKLWN
jgi:hypothetical protein